MQSNWHALAWAALALGGLLCSQISTAGTAQGAFTLSLVVRPSCEIQTGKTTLTAHPDGPDVHCTQPMPYRIQSAASSTEAPREEKLESTDGQSDDVPVWQVIF